MQDSWLRCVFSWIENAFLLAKGRTLRMVNKTQMVNNSKDCLIRQQNIHSVAPEYCIFRILLFLYICTLQLHISDLLWRLQISPVYRIFIPSDGFDSSHSWKSHKHEQNKNGYFEKIFTKFEEKYFYCWIIIEIMIDSPLSEESCDIVNRLVCGKVSRSSSWST